MKGTHANEMGKWIASWNPFILLVPPMTFGGGISINALFLLKRWQCYRQACCRILLQKIQAFHLLTACQTCFHLFYSSIRLYPQSLSPLFLFLLDIQKPYLIRQPFEQESISVIIGMTGDIRGRCSFACMVMFSYRFFHPFF